VHYAQKTRWNIAIINKWLKIEPKLYVKTTQETKKAVAKHIT